MWTLLTSLKLEQRKQGQSLEALVISDSDLREHLVSIEFTDAAFGVCFETVRRQIGVLAPLLLGCRHYIKKRSGC